MKKLLFIAVLLISTASFGQTPAASPALKMSNDSVTQAATSYAYLGSVASLGNIVGGSSALGIVFKAVKVSGTVGATVTLQGSNNGTDWVTWTGATVATLTDVSSQTGTILLATINYKFVRLAIVPSGTQRFSFRGNFQVRSNGGLNN